MKTLPPNTIQLSELSKIWKNYAGSRIVGNNVVHYRIGKNGRYTCEYLPFDHAYHDMARVSGQIA